MGWLCRVKWWCLWHLRPGHDLKRLWLVNAGVAKAIEAPILTAWAQPRDYRTWQLGYCMQWDGELYGAFLIVPRGELWWSDDDLALMVGENMAMLHEQAVMTLDSLADDALGVRTLFPSKWLLSLMEEDYDEVHDIENVKAVVELDEEQRESEPVDDDSYWLARALQRQELQEQVFGGGRDGRPA